MTGRVQDRVLLIVIAIGVGACLALVGYVGYRLGFDGGGVLVVVESVLAFAAALAYCRTSWPNWYRRRALRRRVVVTVLVLLAIHAAIIAVTFGRLRAEWGAPVWMGDWLCRDPLYYRRS